MAIMIDADVIIRGERANFDLRRWFASRENDSFEIAAITVAELWRGVERATEPHKTARRKYLEANCNHCLLSSTQNRLLITTLKSGRSWNPRVR
jgi:predicted nucleic acid-binding protein